MTATEEYHTSGIWRIVAGNRQVVSTLENGRWSCRLYVNKGETATTTANKLATREGVRRWAAKVLNTRK